MGILKVGAGAAASVLEDSWREYFYCPSLEADVLAKKGENRRSGRSRNTKGSESWNFARSRGNMCMTSRRSPAFSTAA